MSARDFTLSILLTVLVTPAFAQAPREDGDDGARAAEAELDVEAYKEQMRQNRRELNQAVLQRRSAERNPQARGAPYELMGRLEAFEDGHMLLSAPLTPEQRTQLLQNPRYRAVSAVPTVWTGDRTVFRDRRFFVVQVKTGDDAFPDFKVARRMGQEVRVEVQNFRGRGLRALDIRRADPSSGQ